MSKSRITVEVSEFSPDEKDWTEAMITVEREDEPDGELRYQMLCLTKAELADVHRRLGIWADQGIWTTGTIER